MSTAFLFSLTILMVFLSGCGSFYDTFLSNSSGETEVIHRGYRCVQSEIPSGQLYAEFFSIYDVWHERTSSSGASNSNDFKKQSYLCGTKTGQERPENLTLGDTQDWKAVCRMTIYNSGRKVQFTFLLDDLVVEVIEDPATTTRRIPCEAFEEIVSTYH